MVETIEQLLANNRRFVAEQLAQDPQAFHRQASGQHPQFLWIGCSDSRVSPNLITGTAAGDMFVHRNVANLVVPTDINLLSVLQYAVEVLRVPHVIVCGHYGCGGVQAALAEPCHGLIDHWLCGVRDTRQFFRAELDGLDDTARARRLVELNVVEQVHNLGRTSTVQRAWQERGRPWIHGWVFDIDTGHLHPQTPMIGGLEALGTICKFDLQAAS